MLDHRVARIQVALTLRTKTNKRWAPVSWAPGTRERAEQPLSLRVAAGGFLVLSGECKTLRQPVEDGVISVARVGGRSQFPARFRLVATINL